MESMLTVAIPMTHINGRRRCWFCEKKQEKKADVESCDQETVAGTEGQLMLKSRVLLECTEPPPYDGVSGFLPAVLLSLGLALYVMECKLTCYIPTFR